MATTETESASATRHTLVVTLTNGEQLEAEARDGPAAREELAAMHRRLDSESFVRIGDDTIVRSADVRTVQVRTGDEGGILDSLKDKIGGRQMSSYDTEQGSRPTAVYGPQGAPVVHRQGDGAEGGFADQFLGYGRRPYAETKPFFLTSEFLAFVLGVAGVLIAAGMADNFDAPRAWLIAAVITAAYIVSRGIAKAGSRDPNPRERASWNR